MLPDGKEYYEYNGELRTFEKHLPETWADMKIINVPIESLTERYSGQWNKWFPEQFKKLGINFMTVYAKPMSSTIRQGQFLDIIGTNYFKFQQLSTIMELFDDGAIEDSDVFLFHDLWLPGLESIAYVRDALKMNFKIAGILHAGTYDEWDFLAQSGMCRWGKNLEKSWLELVDYIFVATEFHKNLICNQRGKEFYRKIFVTGLPYYDDDIIVSDQKENIVVFPHRLAPEKQPELFDNLKNRFADYKDWQFIKSKDVCKNKKEYYELLGKSKIIVSFALQETWGIAVLESILSGCFPLLPNRLSYVELYDKEFLYDDFEHLVYKIRMIMLYRGQFSISKQQEKIKYSGANAIRNMLGVFA